jgi:CMP-N-acetylneuraminic acid synthetase
MKTIAIVPCKAKSERLPFKNTKRVGGATLVERAVHVCDRADLVVLATDSSEIAEAGMRMAEKVGVRAVHLELDAELAGKRTQLEDVIAAAIERWPGDRYLLIQPTSPLRRRRHVASCLALLEQTGCDSVVSVHQVTKDVYFAGDLEERTGRFTPWRMSGAGLADAAFGFWYGAAASCFLDASLIGERRFTSELDKLVSENGAVYAWTHAHWQRTGSRMGGDMRAMEMDPDEAIDIDTPQELERAQRRFGWGAE